MFDFYIKKKIKSAIADNERKHRFLRLAEMKRIVILFDKEDREGIKVITDDLKKQGKEVISWTICRDLSLAIPDARIINQKDVSKWFGISTDVVEEFSKLQYDTLLDLTNEVNDNIIRLLSVNNADFCIGIKEIEYKLYDFIILKEEDKNIVETYEQIKFYLSNVCQSVK